MFNVRIMKVIRINPDKTCQLCEVADTIVLKCPDHVALDGLPSYKLGMFVAGDGPFNPVAANLIKMLRMKYGMSTAGDNAHGIAYLYLDDSLMTGDIWSEIRQFIKVKRARSSEENAKLAQEENNHIQATLDKLMSGN